MQGPQFSRGSDHHRFDASAIFSMPGLNPNSGVGAPINSLKEESITSSETAEIRNLLNKTTFNICNRTILEFVGRNPICVCSSLSDPILQIVEELIALDPILNTEFTNLRSSQSLKDHFWALVPFFGSPLPTDVFLNKHLALYDAMTELSNAGLLVSRQSSTMISFPDRFGSFNASNLNITIEISSFGRDLLTAN